MKYLSLIALLIFASAPFSGCKEKVQEETPEQEIPQNHETLEIGHGETPGMDSIEVPEGYSKLADVTGNLDKDEEEERVIVYDTPREGEYGKEREIRVYKRTYDGVWSLWHKAQGAVLPSRSGGMMGDPFEGVSIERACIVLEHFGGSREKWNYTHRFRRQNKEWKLIGATIRYGAPCDYWDHFDYNLSTGKGTVKKEKLNCDDESQNKIEEFSFVHKLETLPDMEGYFPGDQKIEIKESGDSFYY